MQGRCKLGTNLPFAYFDQLRDQLDPEATVAETISPGSDWVEIGTRAQAHHELPDRFFLSFATRKSPVKMLSGGERNRLLLARLFARPANLVVLDEPTNDLDIESLELLEQKLQDYSGTLLLVSHDRRFLDNVVTQTLAAEGGGLGTSTSVVTPTGCASAVPQRRKAPSGPPERRHPTPRTKPRARLSYKDQRELASLPEEIETLEREQAELNALMSSADYHRRGAQQIRDDRRRSEEIEAALLAKFERWQILEEARK